jgi:penicillin amidase
MSYLNEMRKNKKSFGFLYPLLALLLLVLVLNRKIFITPAIGPLLNPFSGVLQNGKSVAGNKEICFGLKNSIEIQFDERSIPHIFASTQNDVFFAQGYVSATDRLWQMDFLSFVAAGRLSEIFGSDLLTYDREQRRLGILSSAKTSLEFIESNPETKSALDNYTKGVNKYIDNLSEVNLPVEYKLMDYRPEPWSNLKSVLIMKYMGALLSGYEEDLSSSYLLAALGKRKYDKLFSNYFINESTNKFSLDLVSDSLSLNSYINFPFLESSSEIRNSSFNARLGSNSWVIGPKKSISGSAILCNDPHLNLSLPAIWYELQLQSDKMNVYGYSIPGTPGIIIGYNQHISWGLTNGSTDVRDFFKLELKEDYSQFRFDGAWKNTKLVIEEIKVRNNNSFFDTIFYSLHGPISSDFRFGKKEKVGLATTWTLYDPSNEFLTFIKLNKASNYIQFKEAIQHYKCPVQNFSYADVEGNIATHLQGEILMRRLNDRGKFILDGTKSEHLSKKILTGELPFKYNPNEGFVCSANSNPFHKYDSCYINGHFSELRYGKIKQLLARPIKFTADDMKLMQLDNTNRLAELAVPILLNFVREDHSSYLEKFRNWDYKYTKETEMAWLFDYWWDLIKNNTGDELKRYKEVYKRPDDLVLLDLINNDPNSNYFDILSTDKKETAGDIVRQSFEALNKLYWYKGKWGWYNNVNIMHLSNIPAFSREKIPSSGSQNSINAMSNNWGPSARFIVEMKEKPEGYGIYAGGQSGNPASKEYDGFVNDWSNGKYYKLNFFLDRIEGESKAVYKWIIK